MPWIDKDHYIETDWSDLEPMYLMSQAGQTIYMFQRADQEAVAPALPIVAKLGACKEALNEAIMDSYRTPDGKGHKRNIKSAEKALCEVVEELGRQVVLLIALGKIKYWEHGFPYLSMYRLRRPTNIATFNAHYDRKNQQWELKCSKRPALLLFFIWDASEDGGVTWIRLGRGKTPTFTTKKLDPDKQYVFRLQMKNPAGQSDDHFCNRHLATVPLAYTRLPTRYPKKSRKRGRPRRRR